MSQSLGQPSDASGDSNAAVAPERRRRRVRTRQAGALSSSAEKSDYALLALLALPVVGSVLAVGTVHVKVLLVVATLMLATGVYSIFLDRSAKLSFSAPALILCALTGYTILQLLPLPRALTAALAPRNLDVWDSVYDLLKQRRLAWVPITIDPRATLVEALKWMTYTAAFIAASRAGRQLRPGLVPALIFASALIAALSALGHRLVGATTLYGIYKPIYITSKEVSAPLLNLNNFAGYLNLGAFAGLGLMVARDSLFPRWAVALAVSLVVGVSVTSVSRGGFITLLLGVGVLVWLLRRRRFEDSRRQRLLIGLQVGAVALGIGLFALSARREDWHQLVGESLKKFAVISWTKPLILNHFWFGVGRGAFETAFPAYRADGGGHVYQMAENFLAQWCAEWGAPVSLLALGALAWTLAPTRLGIQRSSLALSCSIGVGVLLLQNLADLGLELPSVSIALFVLLGGLYGSAQQQRRVQEGEGEPAAQRPLLAVALAVAGVALLAFVALLGTWTAERDRRYVAAHVESTKKATKEQNQALLSRIQSTMLRHPGDPYLPLAAAITARRLEENPLPWIRGALERDPMSGRPYLLLAMELARRGATDQSLLSVRQAIERDASLSPTAATLALFLTKDLERLRQIAPPGRDGAPFLAYAGMGLSAKDQWQQRTSLLEATLQRDPENLSALTARIGDLLAALETQKEACAADKAPECRKRLDQLLAQIARTNPKSPLPVLGQARLLLADQRVDDADKLLASRCPELTQGAAECTRLWFSSAVKRGDEHRIDQAATSYLGVACSSPGPCERAAIWLGDQFGQRGAWGTALRMYERAARESDSAMAWNRVAHAAARAGLYSVAQRAVQRLRRRGERIDPQLVKDVDSARVQQLNQLNGLPP